MKDDDDIDAQIWTKNYIALFFWIKNTTAGKNRSDCGADVRKE